MFGWIQAETETDEYKERNDAFEEAARRASTTARSPTRFTYLFDPVEGR